MPYDAAVKYALQAQSKNGSLSSQAPSRNLT
jgi:hypothetical protein